jgi:hypothetical protein
MHKELRPEQIDILVGSSPVNTEFSNKVRELDRRLRSNGMSYRDWESLNDRQHDIFTDNLFLDGECASSPEQYVKGAVASCGCPDTEEELHHHSPVLMREIEKQEDMLPDMKVKIGEGLNNLNGLIDLILEDIISEEALTTKPAARNQGEITEGIFVLGWYLRLMYPNKKITAQEIMDKRQEIAKSKAGLDINKFSWESQPFKSLGVLMEAFLGLKGPSFWSVFVDKDDASSMKWIVTKDKVAFKELVAAAKAPGPHQQFIHKGEPYFKGYPAVITQEQAQEILNAEHQKTIAQSQKAAVGTAAFLNAKDLGIYMMKTLAENIKNAGFTEVKFGAVGAEAEDAGTADFEIIGEPGRVRILASSLKAGNTQLMSAGKPGLGVSQGGGGTVKGGGWESVGPRLLVPEVADWMKNKIISNGETVKEALQKISDPAHYGEAYSAVTKYIADELNKVLSDAEKQRQLLANLATAIIKQPGEEEFKMDFLNVEPSKQSRILPKTMPDYMAHFGVEAKQSKDRTVTTPKRAGAKAMNIKEVLGKISEVKPLPETLEEFASDEFLYNLDSAFVKAMQELIQNPDAIVGALGPDGLEKLGIDISDEDNQLLQKKPKDMSDKDYEKKKKEITSRIEDEFSEAFLGTTPQPDLFKNADARRAANSKFYDSIRAKLETLMPKKGDTLFKTRLKLVASGEEKLLWERSTGLDKVGKMTTYLNQMEAAPEQAVKEYIDAVWEESKNILQKLKDN